MAKNTTKALAYHVSHSKDKWVIRTLGQPSVGRSTVTASASPHFYSTQLEAVRVARAEAKKSGASLVIHGLDGRIVDVDRYRDRPLASKLIPARQ